MLVLFILDIFGGPGPKIAVFQIELAGIQSE